MAETHTQRTFLVFPDSVPLPAAELWYAERGLEDLEQAVDGGVVSLDKVPDDERIGLRAYWESCQRFWAALDSGEEPGPWLGVRRQLVDARQRRNQDLVDELEALMQVGAFGNVVEYFCDADPDLDRVLRMAADVEGELRETKLGRELALVADGELVWPDVLGGPAGPGEWSRTFLLEVSHAQWRDRRTRRLVALRVFADEIWPAVPKD